MLGCANSMDFSRRNHMRRMRRKPIRTGTPIPETKASKLRLYFRSYNQTMNKTTRSQALLTPTNPLSHLGPICRKGVERHATPLMKPLNGEFAAHSAMLPPWLWAIR